MIFKFDESKAGKDAPESLIMTNIAITSDYQETDNPHRHIPQIIVDEMPELHALAEKGTVQAIKKLERWVEKYPKVPALYNYLSIAYLKHRDLAKFEKINALTMKRFPGYSLPFINQANRHIIRKEFEQAEAILGHNMEMSAFLPNRQVYHISEVVQFYETTVRFFIYKRQFDVADSRLNMLRDISKQFDGFHKEKIQQLEKEKADEREEMREEDFEKYSVEAQRKEWVAQTDIPPVFIHPEIQWLYEFGLDIPKEKIETLLALPRPTLVADLHKVLNDAMARFDYFYEQECDENSLNFPNHALFLLAELRSTESLDLALNFMRQDDEWAHYWFSDLLTEIFPIFYYKMIGDDWQILKDYLLEPYNEPFQRMVIPAAIAIIGYHHPDKRQAAIHFLEDILNDFYENRAHYTGIIDIELIESIVHNLVELEAKDVFPLIEKLYHANMITDFMAGDLDEIRAYVNETERRDFFFKTISNIFDSYQEVLSWGEPLSEEKRQALAAELEESKKKLEENKKQIAEKERELAAAKGQLAQLLSQAKPDLPKAGRNDPCPCGSGKKYKKCCGA